MTAENRFQDALSKLEKKHQRFVLEYIDSLNGAKAARAAGFSEKRARQQAWAMSTNRYIQEVIELGLEARAMGRNEILSRLNELAIGSMEDFVTIEEVEYRERIEVPAHIRGNELRAQMAVAMDRLEGGRLSKQDREAWEKVIVIVETELEKLPSNPLEMVKVEGQLRKVMQVRGDLVKAERLGKMHLIRKLKQTERGVEFELYSSFDALVTLGRARGLLEVKTDSEDFGDSTAFLESFARGQAAHDAAKKKKKDEPN